ncbi:hypothetical protein BJ912DRAFT_1060489 [Pholiota molesta]|nr:hypothetical protein BJ912DRAFT_1060489 [Pholiota molesta]
MSQTSDTTATTNSPTTQAPSLNTAAITQTTQDTNIPSTVGAAFPGAARRCHPPRCPAQPPRSLPPPRWKRRGHRQPARAHASPTSCFAGFWAVPMQTFFGRSSPSVTLRTVQSSADREEEGGADGFFFFLTNFLANFLVNFHGTLVWV